MDDETLDTIRDFVHDIRLSGPDNNEQELLDYLYHKYEYMQKLLNDSEQRFTELRELLVEANKTIEKVRWETIEEVKNRAEHVGLVPIRGKYYLPESEKQYRIRESTLDEIAEGGRDDRDESRRNTKRR